MYLVEEKDMDFETIEAVVNNCDVNERDGYGNTALDRLSVRSSTSQKRYVYNFLVENGAFHSGKSSNVEWWGHEKRGFRGFQRMEAGTPTSA
jgi:hypothetical protein